MKATQLTQEEVNKTHKMTNTKRYTIVTIDLYKTRATKHPKQHTLENVTLEDINSFVNSKYSKFMDYQVYDSKNKFLCSVDSNN